MTLSKEGVPPVAAGHHDSTIWEKVTAIASALAALAPLIIEWVSEDVLPPWPRGAARTATGIGIAAAVIAWLAVTRWRQLRKALVCAPLVIAVIALVSYLLLNLSLVEHIDDKTIVIKGFGLTKQALEALQNRQVSENNTRWLLEHFGFESERDIWTGIVTAKAALFLTFTATIAGAAAALAALVPSARK